MKQDTTFNKVMRAIGTTPNILYMAWKSIMDAYSITWSNKIAIISTSIMEDGEDS